MNGSKLKTCACGGQPRVVKCRGGERPFYVTCGKDLGGCGLRTLYYASKADSVKAWNDNIGNSLVRDVKDMKANTCVEATRAAEPKKLDSEKIRRAQESGSYKVADAFVMSIKPSCIIIPKSLGVSMNIGTATKPVEVTTANVDEVCASLQAIASLMRKC